ncbi:hypothetical protein TREMEDRAFT_62968, partial [Tremella mesenterica DSM 1558]|uniref:uncharacterized protein n=1 Tax=Tremella mesenterica (strain ATCC 24925 / CBS 8224 / DSM 1558 / NBRC 9311 / NRRL Y-6157 / RJB 2259-6 / UBC 559-6) TaxID=578456 RepID=UPI0003F48ED6
MSCLIVLHLSVLAYCLILIVLLVPVSFRDLKITALGFLWSQADEAQSTEQVAPATEPVLPRTNALGLHIDNDGPTINPSDLVTTEVHEESDDGNEDVQSESEYVPSVTEHAPSAPMYFPMSPTHLPGGHFPTPSPPPPTPAPENDHVLPSELSSIVSFIHPSMYNTQMNTINNGCTAQSSSEHQPLSTNGQHLMDLLTQAVFKAEADRMVKEKEQANDCVYADLVRSVPVVFIMGSPAPLVPPTRPVIGVRGLGGYIGIRGGVFKTFR